MKKLSKKSTLLISLLLFFGAIYYTACHPSKKKTHTSKKASTSHQTILSDHVYTGEKTCKECHEQEYNDWKGSHHDQAMMPADSASVKGNFNSTTFTNQDGMKTSFFKKGKEYWVNTQGPDGEYHDYQVIYTFGTTPLQQYIVKFPQGKFQCLSTAWDTIGKKWFDLYPTFHVVPTEWLHQSRGAMNWNTMCADCHSTNLRKNYFEKADSFNTQYSIIDVSCEACHGPGIKHAELAKENEDQYHFDPERENLYLTSNTPSQRQVDQCARCHSRREQLTLAYNHEGTFLDHYYPQLLEEGAYHGDGQIQDEVYVYGSFLQSKMYHNNVKCTDCHNPHSMQLKLIGNALCLQCHQAETYNAELHTFHKEDSEGSQCINCHMTGKLYMVNDYRRDHSFRIPRPDLSMKYDTPNACNNCHTDKSNEWTYEAYKKWYGPIDSLYYTDILSLARTGDPAVAPYLIELTKNQQYPSIVRATGLQYLSRYADANTNKAIENQLNNTDPLIRAASIDALNEYDLSPNAIAKLWDLLQDETRAVRIKAFKSLVGLPQNSISETQKEAYNSVKTEYLTSLKVKADFSGGQAEKAIYYQKIGNVNLAIASYQKALEIDNYNNPARNNLANLYYQNGEYDKAEECFRTIIEQEPEHGQSYYSLGLLLSEKGEMEKAIPEFKKAIKLMPDYPRIYYNLGLIYQNIHQNDQAEKTFLDGLSRSPQDESLLYALVFFYANVKQDLPKAKFYLEQLVNYYPENQQYQSMLNNFQ